MGPGVRWAGNFPMELSETGERAPNLTHACTATCTLPGCLLLEYVARFVLHANPSGKSHICMFDVSSIICVSLYVNYCDGAPYIQLFTFRFTNSGHVWMYSDLHQSTCVGVD